MDCGEHLDHGFQGSLSSFYLSGLRCVYRITHYLCHNSSSITILLIYVNDILLIENDSVFINQLLEDMHKQFDMRSLGNLWHFLGIEFILSRSNMFLS